MILYSILTYKYCVTKKTKFIKAIVKFLNKNLFINCIQNYLKTTIDIKIEIPL